MSLDQVRERWAAATPGPWEGDGVDIVQTEAGWATVLENEVSCSSYCYGGSVRQEIKPEDKAAILAAPTDVGMLLGAVDAVLALHKFADRPVEGWAAGYSYSNEHCGFDGEPWPCRTVHAITAATGGQA